MTEKGTRPVFGFLLAFLAGFGWGSMGVAAQVMMTDGGFTAGDLVSLRVFGAGAVLAAFSALTARHAVRRLFTDRKVFVDVFIYGLGVLATQLTFFLAIRDAGAATAALMVLTGPLFIIGWLALRHGVPVSKLELLAFACAAVGVSLIVTKGDLSIINFSFSGVLWGLASSACGAFCTLQPRRAIATLGVGTVVGWGMLLSGLVALIVHPPFSMSGTWSVMTVLGYAYIVLIGTALAFFCYLKSLDYVPPSVTAILGAFEPLTAVVMSVTLLGTAFTMPEAIGIVFIFATVFILAMREKRR